MIDTDISMASVTSAEFVRRFGRWQDRAATRPVFVTHHGRQRLVMLSMAKYQALTASDDAARPASDGETRLATVLDRVAQGFMAFDRELRFTQLNPVACAYLKTTRAAIVGQTISERLPDLAKSLVHGALVRAATAGEVAAFDAPSLAYPGHWLNVQTFPYGDGAACLFRNITAEFETRRLAEAQAAAAAAMAAHGGIGRGRLTPRGTFADVDATLATMSGFSPESLLHARLTDILPLNRRVAAGAAIEAVLAGQGARALDSALMVNNGAELPVRIALAELRGEHASEGAVIAITARA